jgi:hydroxymethylpyrimidine pyrophosphatase-like HAD family hydrolase
MNDKTEKKIMLDVLNELGLLLDPIKNKAWDQKTFYSGYYECAKELNELIHSKICQLEDAEETIEETTEEIQEKFIMEAPLIVEP